LHGSERVPHRKKADPQEKILAIASIDNFPRPVVSYIHAEYRPGDRYIIFGHRKFIFRHRKFFFGHRKFIPGDGKPSPETDERPVYVYKGKFLEEEEGEEILPRTDTDQHGLRDEPLTAKEYRMLKKSGMDAGFWR
jgi:hypothetical protein